MIRLTFALVVVGLMGPLLVAEDRAMPFVKVSPRDARYFETSDGRPYIPIGLNFIAPPYVADRKIESRLAELDKWLEKLAANGGNHMRVWLSNDFYEVEHEKAGQYDPQRAAERIDAMLKLARKRGIYVKMTVEHFREIDPVNPRQAWACKAIHHKSRGGLAETMEGWVASAEARKQFIGKLEFLSGRYRDEPAVYGWELWNEMNAIRGGDYMGWTRAMLPELHRCFPNHLCMQSLGSFDTDRVRENYRAMAAMPGNDVAQVHRYLDLGAKLKVCGGPVDVLAAEAVREMQAAHPGKPIMLAESGAVEPSHAGPFKLYAKDKAGIILHDVLFAPFFAGAAGSGQCWHWDQYVNKNDLWWQFGRFAAAVKNIDPAAEKFEPVMVDHPRLRVYLLKGRQTLLAWCRDSGCDWRTELAEEKRPEKLANQSVNLGEHLKGFGRKATVYDPWSDASSEALITPTGSVELPVFERSIVIRVSR